MKIRLSKSFPIPQGSKFRNKQSCRWFKTLFPAARLRTPLPQINENYEKLSQYLHIGYRTHFQLLFY